MKDGTVVNPRGSEADEAFVEGVEQLWLKPLLQRLPGVGIESDDGGIETIALRRCRHLLDEVLVAAVHAVEEAQRGYARPLRPFTVLQYDFFHRSYLKRK